MTLPAHSSLRAIVATSPILSTILNRWAAIDLPDCSLSGSAIAQTAWNAAFGLSPEYCLADIHWSISMRLPDRALSIE